MDGEDGGAGEVGEKNERKANNEIDEVALDVEPEIVRADGEHTPFTEQDENEADNPGAGNDSDEDGADSEEDVHNDMEDARDGVAAFSDKYII